MQTTISLQNLLEEKINGLSFPQNPSDLYDPLRYFMTLGGKRTRPLLTLLAAELFGSPGEKAMNAALAIELFHNFTLIHDDIMDEAPLRRGKETVHTKWNSNVGILSGDVLFVKAFERLADNDTRYLPDLLEVFNRTATEVCEGQQLDMDFEKMENVSVEQYIEMIRLKTSVLLGAALEMGAIIADASAEDKRLVYSFGVGVGIAFQLQDDILDLYADPDKFGKQVGGDILSNKKTFLLIKAQELASDEQQVRLNTILNHLQGQEKIQEARKLFDELGVKELAREKMEHYHKNAMQSLQKINVPTEAKQDLIGIATYLMNRDI
jgi:geranylgeranyl diphosphate synthase, type II